MLRLIAAAGSWPHRCCSHAPAIAATPKQKMETCKFGADDQKLTGAARKSFMAKCMSDKDSPRGKPMPPSRSRSSARYRLRRAA